LEIRSVVQKALEEKRNEKVIGASLEARVTLRAAGDTMQLLREYEEQLPAIFIVSHVALEEWVGGPPGDESRDGVEPDGAAEVVVGHADGLKCERCWNYSESVGGDARYPTLDARCVRQVEEGWGGMEA
jgi:isoleucyl-tRNA synthetase